jgi:hypothetical protein
MKKKYENIDKLLENELSTEEYDFTEVVIKSVSDVRQKGFFDKGQFLKMGAWKSPRPKKWYESNEENKIIKISGQALTSLDEAEKIEYLTLLKGVSVPVASAILMLINPSNYGVIDIRVWQLMYLYGEVDSKPGGIGFRTGDWCKYLSILRKYAKSHKVMVRDIERTLFSHHEEIQEGNLYN